MEDYLGLHHQVDICLDTFPYNGGTTSFHAITMGVPTLTLAGRTPASRVGACILGHLGLNEFMAYNHEDFVRKGVAWAGNLTELAAIRAGLRDQFERSPLGQPAVVAKGLESALRTMWRRWCEKLPPRSFIVE
jgi:predicted O-linked N-acetylglucosamine transferase (SPINDLY family)